MLSKPRDARRDGDSGIEYWGSSTVARVKLSKKLELNPISTGDLRPSGSVGGDVQFRKLLMDVLGPVSSTIFFAGAGVTFPDSDLTGSQSGGKDTSTDHGVDAGPSRPLNISSVDGGGSDSISGASLPTAKPSTSTVVSKPEPCTPFLMNMMEVSDLFLGQDNLQWKSFSLHSTERNLFSLNT